MSKSFHRRLTLLTLTRFGQVLSIFSHLLPIKPHVCSTRACYVMKCVLSTRMQLLSVGLTKLIEIWRFCGHANNKLSSFCCKMQTMCERFVQPTRWWSAWGKGDRVSSAYRNLDGKSGMFIFTLEQLARERIARSQLDALIKCVCNFACSNRINTRTPCSFVCVIEIS